MSEISYNSDTSGRANTEKSFLGTLRVDNWWAQPLFILLGLLVFIVYGTWSAYQASYYFWGPYISPFYSPLLFVKEGVPGGAPLEHAIFGAWPNWLFNWKILPASPSFLILLFPFAFRFTCYFFRRSYYRGVTFSPPACAVNAVQRGNYKGETGFLTVQNFHRYALYAIIVFIIIHLYDTIGSFFYHGKFGVGVGTLVLVLDTVLLSLYVFGCHSFRHLIGGRDNCFSCSKTKYGLWKKVTFLNSYHGLFGWTSLVWVLFSDLYVRLVSMGIIHDFNSWGL